MAEGKKDCTGLSVEVWAIGKELLPLAAQLLALDTRLHNLAIDIRQKEADIEFLEPLKDAGALASALEKSRNVLLRIIGSLAEPTVAVISNKLTETEAELEALVAERGRLRTRRPTLARKVQNLEIKEAAALRAYKKCKGEKS